MSGYQEFTVASFREYQDIIMDIPLDAFTLYRGQPSDKPLLPKIARFNVNDFRRVEKEMLEDFKRRSLHLIQHYPGNWWDWLALAQHHGMATRLLDWSENPLNAMWFSIFEKDSRSEDYAVVWGFNVPKEDIVKSDDATDPFKVGGTKIFSPNHIIKRISAQLGWFTIHEQEPDDKFIPFEDNNRYNKRLFKIKIEQQAFRECKKRLHQYGINSSTMYPDIDGLAKYVEWLFLGS